MIPDGGDTIQTNLILDGYSRGILSIMPKKSGFVRTSILLGFGRYIKRAQINGIPIPDALDPNVRMSEEAILMYNIHQNYEHLQWLCGHHSKLLPALYEGSTQKALAALYEERRRLMRRADGVRRGIRKQMPALGSILGIAATVTAFAIAALVMYLL